MGSQSRGSFLSTAVVVLIFSVAMGYLEAAVVVYLRAALGMGASVVVPVAEPGSLDVYAGIETARELATLLMIATVGWLAGGGWLERLAWAAVVFGTWDIVYYVGLWLAIDWPPALDTWDILFLVPMTWVGPVWAPMAVSAALVGFGLAAAGRLRAGRSIALGWRNMIAALAGGGIVILSFLVDADRVLARDTSPWSAWPLFWLGMALAIAAAALALWRGARILGTSARGGRDVGEALFDGPDDGATTQTLEHSAQQSGQLELVVEGGSRCVAARLQAEGRLRPQQPAERADMPVEVAAALDVGERHGGMHRLVQAHRPGLSVGEARLAGLDLGDVGVPLRPVAGLGEVVPDRVGCRVDRRASVDACHGTVLGFLRVRGDSVSSARAASVERECTVRLPGATTATQLSDGHEPSARTPRTSQATARAPVARPG